MNTFLFVILGLILLVQFGTAALMLCRTRNRPVAGGAQAVPPGSPTAAPPAPRRGHVEIVRLRPDGHEHIGFREERHPDVKLALRTRGLAIRRHDGQFDLGEQ